MNEKSSYIACGKCVHYFVTYDPKRPRGCKKFGFKSLQSPSLEVFAATGTNCANYQEKVRLADDARSRTARRLK